MCKDCIHERVCLHKANIQNDTYAYMGVHYDTKKCEFFKHNADVAEVKHGKWKKKRDDYDCEYIVCSCCKEEFYPPENEFTFDKLPKYCSECGARMDGKPKERSEKE